MILQRAGGWENDRDVCLHISILWLSLSVLCTPVIFVFLSETRRNTMTYTSSMLKTRCRTSWRALFISYLNIIFSTMTRITSGNRKTQTNNFSEEFFFAGDCLPNKHYCIRVYLRNMNRKANLNICLLWILFLLENNLNKFNSLAWERGADIGNAVWWKHASEISSSSSYWHFYQ